jgi:hypothetical protein
MLMFDCDAMQKRTKWLLILVLTLKIGSQTAIPQQYDSPAPTVTHSPIGIWEAPDGSGGVIGLNLWEEPASLGHGGPPLARDEKDYPVLQIGVYQRVKAKVRCGEENFFDAGWRGPTFGSTTNHQHQTLTIHSPGNKSDWPIDVQLTFDVQADVWKGRFHRGPFDENITLIRVADRPSHDGELCFGSKESNFPHKLDGTNR